MPQHKNNSQKEKSQRTKVVAKGVTKVILTALAAGGVIGIACTFPAIGIIYKEFKKAQWEDLRRRGVLGSTIKRLEKQSLVSWREIDGERQLVLTENGKKKTLRFAIER